MPQGEAEPLQEVACAALAGLRPLPKAAFESQSAVNSFSFL